MLSQLVTKSEWQPGVSICRELWRCWMRHHIPRVKTDRKPTKILLNLNDQNKKKKQKTKNQGQMFGKIRSISWQKSWSIAWFLDLGRFSAWDPVIEGEAQCLWGRTLQYHTTLNKKYFSALFLQMDLQTFTRITCIGKREIPRIFKIVRHKVWFSLVPGDLKWDLMLPWPLVGGKWLRIGLLWVHLVHGLMWMLFPWSPNV